MNIFERIVKCSVASEYETIMTQFLADFPWSIARLFSVSDSGNDVLHENGKAYKQKARNTIIYTSTPKHKGECSGSRVRLILENVD